MRAEWDIIKNKTAFKASGTRTGPVLTCFSLVFSERRASTLLHFAIRRGKYIAFISLFIRSAIAH